MKKVFPVILCGGSGTRLWPLSRSKFPKQFLSFHSKETLFQQAVLRLAKLKTHDIVLHENIILTNEEHRFLAQEQLRELYNSTNPQTKDTFILEPSGKNTAPALTLAALQAQELEKDAILVVAPSDQSIRYEENFILALQNSIRLSAQNKIVILGITPEHAATGYGYIQSGKTAGELGEYHVKQFKEKPNKETALQYLQEGNYTWNSGIFVLPASLWLQAIRHFREDIFLSTYKSWQQKSIDHVFVRPNANAFLEIPAESIDYAVMEKCPSSSFSIQMIPLDAGWNDLGSWDAVWQTGEQDQQKNVLQGDVFSQNSSSNFVRANSRMVATVAVQDLIVVETSDAVLVANKNNSQDVKKIVEKLQEAKRMEPDWHRKVYRPWGWYDNIDEGFGFKVKRIWVNPGAALSLQKHQHRAEHWIVVEGKAEVTCNQKTFVLEKNQSTYIPLGAVHRLANYEETPLQIIEVQSGDYLEEDDIIRFADNYGRGEPNE